jgi:hypothetical protein
MRTAIGRASTKVPCHIPNPAPRWACVDPDLPVIPLARGGGIIFARALRDRRVPIPEIARRVTSKAGKNAGKHPSVASLYRALADTVPPLPAIHYEHRTSLPMDVGHRMRLTGILPQRSR